MRRLVLAVAAMSMLVAAVPAGAAEEWLDEGFENGTDIFSAGAWGMEELDQGHVGRGLVSYIPDGEHWGSSGHWYFEDHGLDEPEELYWRYYLKFPQGFYIEPPARGKLPGPAGLYTYNCLGLRVSTPDEPCWSARMMFSRDYSSPTGLYQDGPDDVFTLAFYTYHLDGPSNRGDILVWDEPQALLDPDQWYCVEGQISLNTPGVKDGILRGWVDGEPAFERTDMRWRRSTESDLDVKSFWFDIYYGGEQTATKDLEIHFDSLALSPERIGCGDGFDGTFIDDDGNQFENDIEWLAASGITSGCGDITFCPDESVTRGQMAAFLSRGLNLPSAGGSDTFTDDDESIFEGDIERLAASEITAGCRQDQPLFCPDSRVTRGQMAAFLTRAFDLPETDVDFFTDDDDSIFESEINRLAASGITTGCSDTSFCPDRYVTRAQMAAFLHRSPLGL